MTNPAIDEAPEIPPARVNLILGDPALVNEPGARARFLEMLNTEERARHDRFLREHSRDEFLLGKAMTRLTLARELRADPREILFGRAGESKPTLIHPMAPDLIFNMSHTRGLVALAYAWREGREGDQIGVDVEWIEPGRESSGLADRFFSAIESQFLQRFKGAEYDRVFFQTWTLKEAWLKARGSGLRTPLRDFWMVFDPKLEVGIRIGFTPGLGEDPGAWSFALLDPTPSHIAAVALGSTPAAAMDLRIEQFDPGAQRDVTKIHGQED